MKTKKMKQNILDKLEEIIPDKKLLIESLKNYHEIQPRKGKNYWYKMSYPIIIDDYKRNSENSEEKWIRRTSWVYSWMGSAGSANLNNIETIDRFEETFNKVSNVKEINPKELIKYTKALSKLLLNNIKQKTDWEGNHSFTSKMLHFIHPDIFPILDNNILKSLKYNKEDKLNFYFSYTLAISEFVKDNSFVEETLDKYSNEFKLKNIGPLRAIDIVLFQNGQTL